MGDAGDITRLLQDAEQGNASAANELFLLVEKDLRAIALKRKRPLGLKPDPEASVTVLVNNVFLNLIGPERTTWQPGDRRKFFGYASKQMHDLLIDVLRRQRAAKRGGELEHQELDSNRADLSQPPPDHLPVLLDLKEALERLHAFAPEDALLFRVRFFLECTFEETADILGISKTEAACSYQRTLLWLKRELKEYSLED